MSTPEIPNLDNAKPLTDEEMQELGRLAMAARPGLKIVEADPFEDPVLIAKFRAKGIPLPGE